MNTYLPNVVVGAISIACIVSASLCLGGQVKTGALSQTSQTKGTTSWGKETNGFQIGISAKKRVYTNGEPITLELVFTNGADTNLRYYRHNLGPDFRITDPDKREGERISEKYAPTPAKREIAKIIAHNSVRDLLPHTDLIEVCRIDNVWDFSKPGKYRISFQEKIIFSTNRLVSFDVVSGSTELEVLPPTNLITSPDLHKQ